MSASSARVFQKQQQAPRAVRVAPPPAAAAAAAAAPAVVVATAVAPRVLVSEISRMFAIDNSNKMVWCVAPTLDSIAPGPRDSMYACSVKIVDQIPGRSHELRFLDNDDGSSPQSLDDLEDELTLSSSQEIAGSTARKVNTFNSKLLPVQPVHAALCKWNVPVYLYTDMADNPNGFLSMQAEVKPHYDVVRDVARAVQNKITQVIIPFACARALGEIADTKKKYSPVDHEALGEKNNAEVRDGVIRVFCYMVANKGNLLARTDVNVRLADVARRMIANLGMGPTALPVKKKKQPAAAATAVTRSNRHRDNYDDIEPSSVVFSQEAERQRADAYNTEATRRWAEDKQSSIDGPFAYQINWDAEVPVEQLAPDETDPFASDPMLMTKRDFLQHVRAVCSTFVAKRQAAAAAAAAAAASSSSSS